MLSVKLGDQAYLPRSKVVYLNPILLIQAALLFLPPRRVEVQYALCTKTVMSYPKGFPSLAEWRTNIPDYEGYIFRRFDYLSARNLQHLESELALLEARLTALDLEALPATGAGVESAHAQQNWEKLEQLAKVPNSKERRRMNLAKKISWKLRNYRKFRLQKKDHGC